MLATDIRQNMLTLATHICKVCPPSVPWFQTSVFICLLYNGRLREREKQRDRQRQRDRDRETERQKKKRETEREREKERERGGG